MMSSTAEYKRHYYHNVMTDEQYAKKTTREKERRRERYASDPEFRAKSLQRNKESNLKHASKRKRTREEKWAGIRKQVFDAYGRVCKCCGEATEKFLTIDHVNNDGAEHRKVVEASTLYRWLIKEKFPEGFQALCYNCNMGKARNNGVCPHKDSNEVA